ncbi:MAG: hypothetical protein K2G32_04070, partial [Oscillospiraceae bacterium]|nr:hypothetical protein [Oscillospiraceae bacterium]
PLPEGFLPQLERGKALLSQNQKTNPLNNYNNLSDIKIYFNKTKQQIHLTISPQNTSSPFRWGYFLQYFHINQYLSLEIMRRI